MAAGDWGERAFAAGYSKLYAHRSLEAARTEVSGLRNWIGPGAWNGPVLDAGCGAGRHVAALRAHGVNAFGLDRALPLLCEAPRELRPRLLRADLRAPPLSPASLVGALLLFQVLGHGSPEADLAILRALHTALRPGGFVVVDLLASDGLSDRLVCSERQNAAGWIWQIERRIQGGRVQKWVRGAEQAGPGRVEWCEDLRIVDADQLAGLLAAAGFHHIQFAGDLAGGRGDPRAPRIVALARRAPEPARSSDPSR